MRREWLAVSLAVGITIAASARAIEKPAEIAANAFLGQAYPAGNIYLRPVPLPGPEQSENDYLKAFSWPASISFQSLTSTHPFATRVRKAAFLEVMHDGQVDLGNNTFQLESAYIPALEAMDESHEGCVKRFNKPRNASFEYLSDDFFYSVPYNCNPNEGTGVFRNDDFEKYSFSIVAFSDRLRLTEIEYGDGQRRPLTAQEELAVKEEKEKAKAVQSRCTTEPAFLDSAILLVSGKVADSVYSIRVSTYETPGCGGHLASIYILDIMQGTQLVEVYRLTQYRGAI